jgi:hypothetical protein
MADATLRIWWFTSSFNRGFKVLPSRALGLGHASLDIPRGRGRVQEYISWGGTSGDFRDDTRFYGGIQPEEVQIPLAEEGTKFGLMAEAMRDWYLDWKVDHSYNLVTTNCCDCVVGALTAGGGLYYSQIGTKWLGYDGARTVLNWGKRISAKVVEMNENWNRVWDIAKVLIQEGRREGGVEPGLGRTAGQVGPQLVVVHPPRHSRRAEEEWLKVPTLAEWKNRSAVLVGSRKEQVLKMDQLLAEYDQMRNPRPEQSEQEVFRNKVNILRKLVLWAGDHLSTKPGSDRRGAVLRLASAAWYEHNRLAQNNRTGVRCDQIV